jgi:hypothetical protein
LFATSNGRTVQPQNAGCVDEELHWVGGALTLVVAGTRGPPRTSAKVFE